jgi:heme exporter protein D
VAPSKRPSKSKRYRQNKAQREARAARSARAGEATAIARGERAPVASAPRSSDAAAVSATGKGAAASRGERRSPWTVPGQRAAVLAFLFTIVSAVTLLVAPIQVPREVPADDPRVEEGDEVAEDGTVTIFEEGKLVEEEDPAVAAAVLLAPIAITGAAVWFTKRPQRSTAWSIAMVALAGYVFFVGSYGIITLPSLIALAVASFQSRRAENKGRMADIKAKRASREQAAEGHAEEDAVIDVEAVDADDAEIGTERSEARER